MDIQISNLSKSFGGQEVLKNISFTISGNEKVGLVGRNGCGKSTLFKIILREEEPDEGSVIFTPKQSQVGYLPQVIGNDHNFSSGQKVKKILEEVLESQCDFLFLDEPTNHLDWSGLEWLEEKISSFEGGILVVSHDRKFLDNTVDRILELENGQIKAYGGNYSFYREQKEIEKLSQERKYIEQQKRISKLRERIRIVKNKTRQLEARTSGKDHYVRRKAAKAAKSAISIEKRIAKEISEAKIPKPEPSWELRALFNPRKQNSGTVLQLKSISKSFSDKKVLDDVSFLIERNEKVALIGDNGSGKTTIIKLILGEIKPDSGVISLGNNVEIGYLSQEYQELESSNNVLDELVNAQVDKTQAYKLLHRFLLSSEKVTQPVNLLSSGEKAKLLLAKIMSLGSNFIILDEPTNHLDIPSREALEEAIASYPGSLLIVSHDRYFLERIKFDKLFLVKDGKVSQA